MGAGGWAGGWGGGVYHEATKCICIFLTALSETGLELNTCFFLFFSWALFSYCLRR